ncbi:MAG: phage portal protein [Archaeoglobus sp.]|nr:phage portal protein [Archaeoglobus sp.]
MSFISRIALKNQTIDQYFQENKLWLTGTTTKAGTMVTQQTALRLSTLLACIRVRTESFGCLPCAVYRKRKNGKGRDEAYDHPLYEIIHNTPSENMTALTWRETMNMNFDADGNCYSIIEWNRRGQVIRLIPVPYYLMEPKLNEETGEVEYHYNDRGKIEVLPAEKVYHVPGFSFDGIKGISIIRLAGETFGRGLAIDEFINRFYGQGMNFGVVLETDKIFKDGSEEVEFIRKQFEERYGGLANAHRPIILHNGLKVNRIPISFTDAQTIEILKLTDEQICGLMRVPPHMIAHLDRATFSNIEHQGIEYVIYSMLPIVTRHEQEMRRKLFTRQEREEGYYVKFNVDALLRGDAKARAEALAIKRQNGIINADEWRELDDENPIGGLAGSAYLVNGNMISTETAAKQLPKRIAKEGGDEKDEE